VSKFGHLNDRQLLELVYERGNAQHAEVNRRIDDLEGRIDRVKRDLLEAMRDGSRLTAQAIEAQLEPIRDRLNDIADDVSKVNGTVHGADFLAHKRVEELEQWREKVDEQLEGTRLKLLNGGG
jgi:archaellum component FlaC